MKTYFSIDGGATYVEADQGVRVIVTDVGSEDNCRSVHFNFTHEGQIVDSVDEQGECQGTSARTYGELLAYLEEE